MEVTEKLLYIFVSIGVLTLWYYIEDFYKAAFMNDPPAPWEVAGMYAIPAVATLILVWLIVWRLRKRRT